MELLTEWFSKDESDLYMLGYAIIFAMLVLPAKKQKYNSNFLLIGVSFSIYIICETILTVLKPSDYAICFVALFVGGAAFSVAAGRLAKFYLLWIKKEIHDFAKWHDRIKHPEKYMDEENEQHEELTELEVTSVMNNEDNYP